MLAGVIWLTLQRRHCIPPAVNVGDVRGALLRALLTDRKLTLGTLGGDMPGKPHTDRPGRRVGAVGQAYLAARAVQSEKTRKALKRIAEGN